MVRNAFGKEEKRGPDCMSYRYCKLTSFQFLFRDGTGCSYCLRYNVPMLICPSISMQRCPIQCNGNTEQQRIKRHGSLEGKECGVKGKGKNK